MFADWLTNHKKRWRVLPIGRAFCLLSYLSEWGKESRSFGSLLSTLNTSSPTLVIGPVECRSAGGHGTHLPAEGGRQRCGLGRMEELVEIKEGGERQGSVLGGVGG